MKNKQQMEGKFVGVYKLPPIWTKYLWFRRIAFYFEESFNYDIINDKDDQEKIIKYDIYYLLSLQIARKRRCYDFNYIIIDTTLKKNVLFGPIQFESSIEIKIWKLKDLKSLYHFKGASTYFLRGTYHPIYKELTNNCKNNFTIYYPATSLSINKNQPIVKLEYDCILVHENLDYLRIYPCCKKYVIFNKPIPSDIELIKKDRVFMFCVVANPRQETKNLKLFLSFLEYLDARKFKIKVLYIGDFNDCLSRNGLTYFELNYVQLTWKEMVTRDEIWSLYSQTKINLLFSGRDAFPRVILESGLCGCFNIALETLSDGKYYYNGLRGVLIKDGETRFEKHNSISYLPSPILWDQIIKYFNFDFDHEFISSDVRSNFSIEKTVQSIID
jgi:hypothetical protein